MEGFLKRNDASKVLKIHYHTLEKLGKNNDIEVITIGNTKFYNIKKFLNNKGVIDNDIELPKKNICYCRVSSKKQSEDLDRQIEYMKTKFPCHEIIYDVASGLNYNRRGLKQIINYAINGEINELVIAYKDRLTRFGYELIEWLIKDKSQGSIKIINNEEELTPQEEITKDIISIMNIYVAKNNGLRKYKKEMTKELTK
jgi:predicted site-specific integrase-resolvase